MVTLCRDLSTDSKPIVLLQKLDIPRRPSQTGDISPTNGTGHKRKRSMSDPPKTDAEMASKRGKQMNAVETNGSLVVVDDNTNGEIVIDD